MSAGSFSCWAQKDGDFKAREFDGTPAGALAAQAYASPNGLVQLGPGCGAITPSPGPGVVVLKIDSGRMTVYGDFVASAVGGTGWRTVDKNEDVQVVIDNAPAGSTLYFPLDAGPWRPLTPAGWLIDKPLRILGGCHGARVGGEKKNFQPYGAPGEGESGINNAINSHVFRIGPNADSVTFEDIMISTGEGRPTLSNGSGCHIIYDDTAVITNIVLRNVSALYAGKSNVWLGAQPDGFIVNLKLDNVYTHGSGSYYASLHVELATVFRGHDVQSWYAGGRGLEFVGCSTVRLDSFVSEGNAEFLSALDNSAQVYLQTCPAFMLTGGHVEEIVRSSGAKVGLSVNNCLGGMVAGCTFQATTKASNSTGILMYNGTKGVTVGPNDHRDLFYNVRVKNEAANVGNLVLPQVSQGNSLPTAPGLVDMPVGNSNFTTNTPSGVTDSSPAGFQVASVADHTALDGAVLFDGLVVFDRNTNKGYMYGNGGWNALW